MSRASDRTRRIIEGALQDTINQHGPVTEKLLESASKRVIAQLRQQGETSVLIGAEGDEATRSAIEAQRKRYEKLRFGHERLIGENAKLRRQLHELAEVIRSIPQKSPAEMVAEYEASA